MVQIQWYQQNKYQHVVVFGYLHCFNSTAKYNEHCCVPSQGRRLAWVCVCVCVIVASDCSSFASASPCSGLQPASWSLFPPCACWYTETRHPFTCSTFLQSHTKCIADLGFVTQMMFHMLIRLTATDATASNAMLCAASVWLCAQHSDSGFSINDAGMVQIKQMDFSAVIRQHRCFLGHNKGHRLFLEC